MTVVCNQNVFAIVHTRWEVTHDRIPLRNLTSLMYFSEGKLLNKYTIDIDLCLVESGFGLIRGLLRRHFHLNTIFLKWFRYTKFHEFQFQKSLRPSSNHVNLVHLTSFMCLVPPHNACLVSFSLSNYDCFLLNMRHFPPYAVYYV